jgi:hypothetical protein
VSDAVTVSIIGGLVTVIGALIGYLTVRARLKFARENPRAVVPEDDEEREAEERYGADPRLFIKDIMDDRRQYREEVAGYRKEVGELRQELKDFREKDRKFRNALARWFVEILATFEHHGIAMPYPIEQDQEILADVIPTALEATRPSRPPAPPPE